MHTSLWRKCNVAKKRPFDLKYAIPRGGAASLSLVGVGARRCNNPAFEMQKILVFNTQFRVFPSFSLAPGALRWHFCWFLHASAVLLLRLSCG